ncbi:sodium bicarbonate cotransporter 3-like isoform X2 [Tachypleus tridentatus]|uniref:sodium bicarbonate cotransporter 3-like isoform X2 n=1 Tax=Tachypleus tridentatus TaxID=6853 RepID=UPI003FD32CA7
MVCHDRGDHGLEYLPLHLWIGLWTSATLIVLVTFDASALVCYITWFTEENFATLISISFIYKAIEKIRAVISDFAFAIMIMIITDKCAGLNAPKLEIPHTFENEGTNYANCFSQVPFLKRTLSNRI